MGINNKWMRAAVPALLIHCSIGTVYCWSTFKEAIAEKIGMGNFSVGWAFSLAIFFLGMSAAFAGRMVEKDIHKSSLIACLCFTIGMIGTGFCINFLKGAPALIGIYLFYGCIMGIGLGIGYLTPVKTLMLWFSEQKGLATGISIMGFGLAKAIATPIMEAIQKSLGISAMFYILGGVYFLMMLLGHFLLKKPDGWVEPDIKKSDFKPLDMFKDKTFLGIWLMFFINIHCGLALITYEKQILKVTFAGMAVMAVMISVIPSVTAAFNALGRIGYSTVSDKMKDRNTVYKIIFATSVGVTLLALVPFAISNGPKSIVFGAIVILLLCVVNLGYGGGFSTLPALLSSRFGMDKISKIHGLALSAWAFAGITGNNMSAIILNSTKSGKTLHYDYILFATLAFYIVAMVICLTLVGSVKKDGDEKMEKGNNNLTWKITSLVLALALILVGMLYVAKLNDKKATDKNSTSAVISDNSLSSWNDDAVAKKELVDYVKAVTKEGSKDFIPVEDRIAVFDLDGTLACETDPCYFDHCIYAYRIFEDPDYKDKASDFEKKVAKEVKEFMDTGVSAPNSMEHHGKAVASAFSGMTMDEFVDYVADYAKNTPAPGYTNMTRGEAFYKPMLEVVELLEKNDFKVYIVSGTDRFIVRGLVKASPLKYLPESQLIGSDESLVASDQGDTDGLEYQFDDDDEVLLGGDFLIKNLDMNKVTVIAQEIGQQPVLAFGNSGSDSSMAEYVINDNKYKAKAFMLCCDDTDRENGNVEKAEKMVQSCKDNGWTAISMKNDWKTIYGKDVKKK